LLDPARHAPALGIAEDAEPSGSGRHRMLDQAGQFSLSETVDFAAEAKSRAAHVRRDQELQLPIHIIEADRAILGEGRDQDGNHPGEIAGHVRETHSLIRSWFTRTSPLL
jgi:hypothetical protein